MPIRLRLTLLAAAGSLVFCVVGSIVFVHLLSNSLRDGTDNTLRSSANGIVQFLQASRLGADLPDPANTGLVNPQQTVAQIITPSGGIRDASDTTSATPIISASELAKARTRTITTSGHLTGLNEDVRILATPMARRDGIWVVVVATAVANNVTAINHVSTGLLVGGAALVLLASSGAWLLSTLALRPVEQMRRQAAELAAGTDSGKAQLQVPATRDELARLGHTLNHLLDALGGALAQQRAFVADAGHELRTPITLLQTELELAERDCRSAADLRRAIANARQDTARLATLTEQLLFLASHDEGGNPPTRELQPLRPLIERCAERARRLAGQRQIALCLQVPDEAVADIDANDVERALDNLLANAVRHAPDGTAVDIEVHDVDPDEDPTPATNAQPTHGSLQIVVRDHGPGFPDSFIPHALERFRRADPGRSSASGGSGLGLAIVQAVATEHGGTVSVANAATGGAEAVIRLPAPDRE
jgi:two-component system, OmpR family, sensor kinase